MNKPKITVIGGGTGIPVILRSLRHKDVDITAVVTVADDGGSSGNLRDIMQLTPPGDLRNVLVAMSDMPKLYERVFQYRLTKLMVHWLVTLLGILLSQEFQKCRDLHTTPCSF